jgi:predicted ABC-type transport system involved in lysophospholipase L1 biosynthesis ATPase subunit
MRREKSVVANRVVCSFDRFNSTVTGPEAAVIGLVFQFYNLIPILTAFENVELPLLLTDLSKAERKTHVETALQAVGLGERRPSAFRSSLGRLRRGC